MFQKWIRLSKDNKKDTPGKSMSKERRPQDWKKPQRFEAIMHCLSMSDEQVGEYFESYGANPVTCISLDLIWQMRKRQITSVVAFQATFYFPLNAITSPLTFQGNSASIFSTLSA